MGACFRLATEKYSYVLRPDQEVRIIRLLETMRSSQTAPGYGQELLDRALLTQFLIAVTRDLEERQLQYVASASCDKKIVAILKYLNLHLSEPQSIDNLSRQFYISKYYMMRRFKAETGYTIHGYLNEKRLLLAREKIGAGEPLIRVSEAYTEYVVICYTLNCGTGWCDLEHIVICCLCSNCDTWFGSGCTNQDLHTPVF